jgi:hypothetical protein
MSSSEGECPLPKENVLFRRRMSSSKENVLFRRRMSPSEGECPPPKETKIKLLFVRIILK